MTSGNVYGEKLVNFMLKREQVFIQFRSCYYLLYQCLVPNTREAMSLLVQHYSVPKDFERTILSGGNPRVCNQGILNYLMIKLRTDRNYVKFYGVLKAMINHPELRVAVERMQKGIHTRVSVQLRSPPLHNEVIISNKDDDSMEGTFPLHEGALSVTDSDDDYRVIYTVTIVDVRSCARPPRSPDQPPASCNPRGTTSVAAEDIMLLPVAQQMLINNSSFAELQSHYSALVRSMPDDYMNTVSRLEHHLTGDHIGSILECKDVFTANQRILDCLIEQLNKKEDVFDLCEKLSNITDASLLTAAIEDLKKDIIISIKSEDSSDSPTNGVSTESPPSLTPNNLSNSTTVVPAAPQRPLVPGIFYKLQPGQYSPRALAILKKHYHALWRSFPDDHMITLSTLCGIFRISDEIIDMITSKPTFEEANQLMLDYVIFITNGDQQMNAFCELMAKIIKNPKLSKVTSNLKKDCMDIALQSMLQSILQRNSLRSTGSSSRAQIKELTEDVAVVTTETSSAGDGQQDGGDIGASVIDHLPAGVSVQCRTMLHSYYDTLWQSFPQDHLITLSRLCDLLPVEERLVETIALYPIAEHDVANRRILNAALSNVKRDNELLGFSLLVEKLIASPNKAKTIETLKADCLKVMEKKQGLVKPSLTEGEQDSVADDVRPNVNTNVIATKRDESSTSGSIDGVQNETTQAVDSRVRLLETDPLVLHVLPSTVSDDGIAVLRKHYHMLLANLPDDHVTTVGIFSESVPVGEVFFNEVISFTDHNIANEKILNAAIMLVNYDTQFKGFAQLAKILVKRDCKFSREMLEFDIDCLNIEENATTPSGSNNDDAVELDTAAKHYEPRVLQALSFSVSPECRLVLKKYYNFLWKSFPKDHMIAYGKLINIIKLDDKISNEIISATSSERGNQIMLDLITIGVNKDKTLMEFYYLISQLIDNPKLLKIMKVFKNECEKAIANCMAKVSSTTSCSIVNDLSQPTTAQSISQITSTDDSKPDGHAAREIISEGDTTEDVEADEIFAKLSSHNLSDNGIAVLKKHYSALLKSLPEDHMVTLGRLCKAIPVDDDVIDRVISCEDPAVANKRILLCLIMAVKNDKSLLDFCKSLEAILQDMPAVLSPLRNDCLKVIESEGGVSLVPATINDDDTHTTVTKPQQSLSSSVLPADNLPATSNTDKRVDQKKSNIMSVFSHLPPNLLSRKGEAILRKYYLPLWRAFPEDYMTSLAKISAQVPLQYDEVNLVASQPTWIAANKSLLDVVLLIKGYDNDLMEFCTMVEAIIGDKEKVAQVVEPLRQECLQLMIEKSTRPTSSRPISSLPGNATISAISAGSHTAITETTSVAITAPVEETSCSQQNAEDTRAALRTFDEHLHLMTLIQPCCIQEGLKTSGLIANSNSMITVMDDMLKEVRSCIECNGAEKFLVFINVLQAEGRYVILGCHIFNKFLSYGGHESSTVKIHQFLSDLPTLPIAELLQQLRWHQKQIVAGLQYQCPMPLPDYFTQRNQLLEAIVNKLTDDDGNPTVGSTVTIAGIGGIGKSTLAKALCHDVRLKSYFLDGFLWIRLGPLPVSPAIKLGQIYHQLTNKTEVGNQTFFIDKLQTLVAEHLHKLLVIIDDVWEVSDALVYTQVFNGCKIVMTTRRENVNKLISSKMCITIDQMNEEEAIKLLTYNLPGQSEITNLLALNLLCWPLLLKLVQGQLSICVREQHKPLPQALDHVEEVLKAKGFNTPGVDKRRSAVLAVIESSMGLLNPDEMNALQKLVLSAGFSMPFPLPLLPAMLKVGSEEIEKLCGKLLRLGLISQCQLMTAPNNKAILCYEVHPIITQYVMDHMTFESPVKLVATFTLGDISVISTVLAGGDDANISYHCLATVTAIDAIILPNHIKSLFILMKCLQHEIRNCIVKLSLLFIRSGRMDLAQPAKNFKDSDAVKCAEKLHQSIREDCKNLHNFLINDRHEQAVDWITAYVKNHALRKTLATFAAFVKDLLHKCHDDSSLVSKIKSHTDKIVLFYKTTLQKHSEHVKVTLRKGLTAMISSGNVTTQQYKQLLEVYCKNLELANSV